MDFETGGRAAIERLVEAYGFTTRQALADHLNVSKSTLANRYLRDTFPSDWIIRCALETGISLNWLTTGNGPAFDDARTDVLPMRRQKIEDGKLLESNYYMFDKALLPTDLRDPVSIMDGSVVYIAECDFEEVTDGKWLVEIEGKTSIRDLTRIPVGKVKVSGQGSPFECALSDITALAKCRSVFIRDL